MPPDDGPPTQVTELIGVQNGACVRLGGGGGGGGGGAKGDGSSADRRDHQFRGARHRDASKRQLDTTALPLLFPHTTEAP
jgi:hypothetical protein